LTVFANLEEDFKHLDVINVSVTDTHIIKKCAEGKQLQIRKLQFDLLTGFIADWLHLLLENTWNIPNTKNTKALCRFVFFVFSDLYILNYEVAIFRLFRSLVCLIPLYLYHFALRRAYSHSLDIWNFSIVLRRLRNYSS